MNISLILQGVLGSILSDVNFFSFFFSRFFLIPSQSASLYIIASFEVYLIDENNYPHVLVVLFQKSYTYAKHIWHAFIVFHKLTIKHDWHVIFVLGGGGAGQNLTEKGFVNFLVLKLVSTITQLK